MWVSAVVVVYAAQALCTARFHCPSVVDLVLSNANCNNRIAMEADSD